MGYSRNFSKMYIESFVHNMMREEGEDVCEVGNPDKIFGLFIGKML